MRPGPPAAPHDAATHRATTVLTVEVIGGAQRLEVFAARPRGHSVLGILPALGVRASYYSLLGERLATHGIDTVLVDLPGHGESPLRASRSVDWCYRDLVERHLPTTRSAIRGRFPDRPFYWLGHSLGGQLALLDGGRFEEEVAGVVLVASGAPYYRTWPPAGALSVLALGHTARGLAAVLGHFPGERVGFGGREARGLIRDWTRIIRTGRYDLGRLGGEAILGRYRRPILAVGLEGDRFAPQASIEHTLAKTASQAISRWTWAAESGRRIDHNRWPRTPERVVERVVEWLADGWPGGFESAP